MKMLKLLLAQLFLLELNYSEAENKRLKEVVSSQSLII